MKARYLGHPDLRDESPRSVGFAGKTFPRGHFVDVTEVGDKLQGKLRGNPAFETSDDPLSTAERAAADTAAQASPAPTADGAAKADVGALDKPALLLRLGELKAAHPEVEITFSDTMGEPKLRSVLEGALFEIGDEE